MLRILLFYFTSFILGLATVSSAQDCEGICRQFRQQIESDCDRRFCTIKRCTFSPFGDFLPNPFQVSIGGFQCVQETISPSPTPSLSSSPTPSTSTGPSPTSSLSPSPLPSQTASMVPTVSATPSASRIASVSMSASPSPSPSESSSISPSVSPSPTISAAAPLTETQVPSQSASPAPKLTSQCASSIGDPHIATFDGLKYDCQGNGEFVLAISDGYPSYEMQARFTQSVAHESRISIATGFVMRHVGVPTIQISFPTQEGGDRLVVGSCDVIAFVNGNARTLSFGSQKFGDLRLKVNSRDITLSAFGMNVVLRIGKFGEQCMISTISVCVPNHPDNNVIGVLGSPNGNFNDEWMSSSGNLIEYPSSTLGWHLFLEPAYDYCTSNWCLKKEDESLFTYETGTDFNTFMKCNEPYLKAARGRSILDEIPPNIKAICKGDKACEIDGFFGGKKAARQFIREVKAVKKIEKKFVESGGENPAEIVVKSCPDACRAKKVEASVDCSVVKNSKKCVVRRCDGGFSCSPVRRSIGFAV